MLEAGFDVLQELGIEHLRYGPPYYTAHKGPGTYDWSFADETFKALHDQKGNAHRGPVPLRHA